jgi:hypothetical protein
VSVVLCFVYYSSCSLVAVCLVFLLLCPWWRRWLTSAGHWGVCPALFDAAHDFVCSAFGSSLCLPLVGRVANTSRPLVSVVLRCK